jgi:signal-transduction protein with cAMP-binding, CBS, and nucleotidyltransferase domain
MRSAKSVLSKRDLNYLGIINSTDVDIFKSPEENLSNIIKNYVFSDNLQHLSDINAIYKLLMKIKNFREFILLNDLGMNLSFNMLKEGILQPYKKDEIIYKKDTYPKYYFLVLVGNISYLNNLQTLINPGCFFGDEIIQRIRYKQTAISSSDKTILLLIPKTFIISNIIDKIILANERIQKCIENSFQVFKTLDSTTFVKNYEKMIKIFPYMDDIIISTKDVANAIFIIYNGICTLNNDKKGDLIILEKGDIIGSESLANIDENGNIMNYTYLYNLINKAHNTIILKFFINEFHPTIINN